MMSYFAIEFVSKKNVQGKSGVYLKIQSEVFRCDIFIECINLFAIINVSLLCPAFDRSLFFDLIDLIFLMK